MKKYYWSLCEFYGGAFDEKHKKFFLKEFKNQLNWNEKEIMTQRKTLPFLIYSLYKNIECLSRFAEA